MMKSNIKYGNETMVVMRNDTRVAFHEICYRNETIKLNEMINVFKYYYRNRN